jgi:hypothetical protein
MTFINKYSDKCLLGPRSVIINYTDNIFCWSVGKKNHFTILNNLSQSDIQYLSSIKPASFHYCSIDNLNILKNNFNVDSAKIINILINIEDLSFIGNKGKSFRNYLNRYKNLTIKEEFDSINDIKLMIEEWSNSLGDKYFRDYSGKSLYFFKQNYHKECDCVFIYDDKKLVSFGVGTPIVNGTSSYATGKALAKTYPGLSEFTDIQLYRKMLDKYGKFTIDLGMSSKKGLLSYKKKFPNSFEETNYNGIIK